MAGQASDFEREVRDTIVKSGLTGVAATVLAVAAFSPSVFGNWIGASVASGFGLDAASDTADNPYANLPAYPAPLTPTELTEIHSRLASTAASLEITRAATDAKIEHVRMLALSGGMVTFTPSTHAATPDSSLRLALSEPSAFTGEAPVESYVIEAPVEAAAAPASIQPSGHSPAPAATSSPASYEASVPYRDPHLELAELLLAHESF